MPTKRRTPNGYLEDKKYIQGQFKALNERFDRMNGSLGGLKKSFYDMEKSLIACDLPDIKKTVAEFKAFKWKVVGLATGLIIVLEITLNALKIFK